MQWLPDPVIDATRIVELGGWLRRAYFECFGHLKESLVTFSVLKRGRVQICYDYCHDGSGVHLEQSDGRLRVVERV